MATSSLSLQQRLNLLAPQLLVLALGGGVMAALSLSGLLEWLLASSAAAIITGLALLGAVVVVLSLIHI